MELDFLFRSKEDPKAFISVDDPDLRYTRLCGNCKYPLGESDKICPRCQRDLEECPVCFERTREMCRLDRDYPRMKAETTCNVCLTKQRVTAEKPYVFDGHLCTNLYGCPAGGYVVRPRKRLKPNGGGTNDAKSFELVYFPQSLATCPICRDPKFPPIDVGTFSFHVNLCRFCRQLYSNLREVREAPGAFPGTQGAGNMSKHVCILCGQSAAADGSSFDGETTFQLAVELARDLIENESDIEAARSNFKRWFANAGSAPGGSVSVNEVVDFLLTRTHSIPHREVLDKRLPSVLDLWESKLRPVGANFLVQPVVQPTRSERGSIGCDRAGFDDSQQVMGDAGPAANSAENETAKQTASQSETVQPAATNGADPAQATESKAPEPPTGPGSAMRSWNPMIAFIEHLSINSNCGNSEGRDPKPVASDLKPGASKEDNPEVKAKEDGEQEQNTGDDAIRLSENQG